MEKEDYLERLDKNKEQFFKLISETAVYFDIHHDYVEKDYWLTLILKEIMNQEYDYVFKGGTSLSKCYHLINRFSEDIDISYVTPFDEITCSQKEKRFRGIIESIKNVGLDISNMSSLKRRAYFNQYICPYDSIFDDTTTKKAVVVELAGQTPAFPITTKPIQSFVGQYLKETKRLEEMNRYGLNEFDIKVITLERTFVDKVFAICDYYIKGIYERHSRHIYDISKLSEVIKFDKTLTDLFKQVRKYRNKSSICYSAREGVELHNVVNGIIKQQVFKKDYNELTQGLLYENISYEECETKLVEVCNFLKEQNL